MGRRKGKRGPQRKRRRGQLQRDPVVGYFAKNEVSVVCDGDACVIAGTQQQMAAVLQQHGLKAADYTIQKTTAGEIVQGMRMGGAYCFDETAYAQFLPPGRAGGLPLEDADFSAEPDFPGVPLLRVQLPMPAFADEDGLHLFGAGAPPDAATLEELSRRYQENIRNSPMWDEMVREFGAEKAEQLLRQCRAELR